MPYTITDDPELLRVEISGEITLAELMELLRTVQASDEELGRARDRLVDIRDISGRHLEFQAVSSVADARKEYGFEESSRIALVAESPISVGFARMYQSLAEHPPLCYRIFTTLEEAERWLGEPPPSPSDSDPDFDSDEG